MSDKVILKEKQGATSVITINRPHKRNALNFDIMSGLQEAFQEIYTDSEIRSVVVKGEGKGFSAGVDFFALAAMGIMEAGPTFARKVIRQMQEVTNIIDDIEKPVIFALHGFCYGMATELAIAGDIRIAHRETKLGIQEVELGLIPDVGGTTRLTRLLGPIKAKELILTGKVIGAGEAKDIQLVNALADDPFQAAMEVAEKINGNAPLAVGLAKRLINRCQHMDQRTFMEMEAIGQTSILWSEDVQEGIMARIEKRAPLFKGK